MVHELGGPRVPAIGFAMGLERILLAMSEQAPAALPFCYLAPIGEAAALRALVMARSLRERGVRAEVDGRGSSLKSMLRRADATGARLCLVLGASELERGVVQLKDLGAHSQQELPLEAAVDHVAERLRTVEPEATGESGGFA
jgi:histidyl-tRNA synthetase